MGFVPTESVVMVSIGRGGPQARSDLPHDEAGASVLAAQLGHACAGHAVDRVVLVVYSEQPAEHAWLVRFLASRLTAAGISVLDCLGATPTGWMPLDPAHPFTGTGLREFDPSTHPYRTEAVWRGDVVLGSREEVAGLLEPCEQWVERVRRAGGAELDEGWTVEEVAAECALLRDQLPGWVAAAAGGRAPDERTTARLVRAVQVPRIRDEAWVGVERGEAREHLEFWIGVLRATPAEGVGAVAGVVAQLAWLSGNGALAWCAVDRSTDAGGSSLTDLTRQLLTDAIAPVSTSELEGAASSGPDPAA